MRFCKKMMPLAVLALVCGCGKKSVGSDPGAEVGAAVETEVVAVVPESPVAEHLGFATRVPADSDFYFSAFYGGPDMLASLEEMMLKSGIAVPSGDEAVEERKKMAEFSEYVGTELFVFVGGGTGDQLKVLGTSYRELSAAWAGFATKAVLGAMGEKDAEPDFEALGQELAGKLSGDWMAAIEKDSRLRIPSVVAGWKPDESKLTECVEAVGKGLASAFKEEEGTAKAVEFERHGVSMKGHEIEGVEVFRELIESLEKAVEEGGKLGGVYSKERIESLMAAMQNVRFTVAAGTLDGRVIIYFGDGADGFELADEVGESLAAKDDLRWMGQAPSRSIRCAAYFSEPMVAALLPWLDTSAYWEALAGAVGPPLRKVDLFQGVLSGLAGVAEELGKREVSAWSAFVYSDPDWVLETRGGILDPSLDYSAPLAMAGAAEAGDPAFRAHWVQAREWKDLSWSKTEYFGTLLELALREWEESQGEETMLPEGFADRLAAEVGLLNRMYRDQFREGVGDEVAVFGDFLGEMPAVPGLSEEMMRDQTVPRLVIARPLVDAEKIKAGGDSFSASVRSVSAWLSESGGTEIPAILPQSIESGGVVTWFVPLPFIGGDFVPGVSISNKSWMMGTSRSLAEGFAKEMEARSSGGETGVIFEVDLERLVAWSEKTRLANEDEIDALAEELRTETGAPVGLTAGEGISDALKSLKRFSYRGWLEGGKPRGRYKLEFKGGE